MIVEEGLKFRILIPVSEKLLESLSLIILLFEVAIDNGDIYQHHKCKDSSTMDPQDS